MSIGTAVGGGDGIFCDGTRWGTTAGGVGALAGEIHE